MRSRLPILLLVLLAPDASRPDDSPWAWTCDADRKACDRVLKTPVPTLVQTSDLLECKMTCADEGLLWPLPTGQTTRLAKTLSLVREATDFSVEETSMDEESRVKVQKFFEEVFQGYLRSMISTTTKKEEKCRQMEYVTVKLHLSVRDPFQQLTLETDESYHLQVSNESPESLRVDMSSSTYFGLRHGLETLSQLVTWNRVLDAFQMHSSADILDAPSYPYRGVMVDTARNFMPVNLLKKIIDGLSNNKLNVLHWHISDATSFPLILPRVPQLAKYGAYSEDRKYSPAEVADLVAYSELRGVRLLPEIDAPRHAANGWQFGEAELNLGKLVLCDNELDARCRGGVCGHLNPVNPALYDVLENVYADLSDMFPSDLVHMGGDEVDFLCWRKSVEVQLWLMENGLTGSDEDMFGLWVKFQRDAKERMDKANLETGQTKKKVVLWTSSLTSLGNTSQDISPEEYIIQIWTEKNDPSIPAIINQGYPVIFSNSDALYLDCGFGFYVGPGNSWCDPYKQWRTIYENQPRQIYLDFPSSDSSRLGQILGAEAAAWSESLGPQALEARVWPRTAALAERLWTDPEGSWEGAERRLLHQRERMVERGILADALQPQWCHQFEGRCIQGQ